MGNDLSLEDLINLAEKQLDAIEANEAFADTTTWLAVLSFAERVQKACAAPALRTHVGFISDADDLWHDIEAMDDEERGSLTFSKVESIRRMIEVHGCSKDWVAKQLQITVDQVEEALRR